MVKLAVEKWWSSEDQKSAWDSLNYERLRLRLRVNIFLQCLQHWWHITPYPIIWTFHFQSGQSISNKTKLNNIGLWWKRRSTFWALYNSTVFQTSYARSTKIVLTTFEGDSILYLGWHGMQGIYYTNYPDAFF